MTFNHALYSSAGQISLASVDCGNNGRPDAVTGSVSSTMTTRHADDQNSFTAYLPLESSTSANSTTVKNTHATPHHAHHSWQATPSGSARTTR